MNIVSFKICINCKHMLGNRLNPDNPKCKLSEHLSVITGKKEYFHCSTQRSSGLPDDCGPDGKHYEPIEGKE